MESYINGTLLAKMGTFHLILPRAQYGHAFQLHARHTRVHSPEGHLVAVRGWRWWKPSTDLDDRRPARRCRASAVPRISRPGPAGGVIYGYATGWFSSRKIQQATYDSLLSLMGVVFIAPTTTTLARLSASASARSSTVVSSRCPGAREHQLEPLRTPRQRLDGTNIHANASRHQRHVLWGHAETIEAHQQGLGSTNSWALDCRGHGANVPDGMSVPRLQRRED